MWPIDKNMKEAKKPFSIDICPMPGTRPHNSHTYKFAIFDKEAFSQKFISWSILYDNLCLFITHTFNVKGEKQRIKLYPCYDYNEGKLNAYEKLLEESAKMNAIICWCGDTVG